MKKLIAGLDEERKRMKEALYRKHWGEVQFPFTLGEKLSQFTKYELDDIRKRLEVEGVSSLKKAELIAVLQQKIPEYLNNIHHLWDTERFKLLIAIAENGGITAVPDNIETEQIKYFRGNGLIYTGTFEGEKVLAVPEELIDQIIALKSNLTVRAGLAQNTEWMKLARGLLYYYGTLSGVPLVDMLNTYAKDKLELVKFFSIMKDANLYRKDLSIVRDDFSDRRVRDPQRVKKEHRMRKNLPYYPFSKQQLLTAGELGFVDRNIS